MANLRLLVKRRKAIRNIRKITRTMELIATARFKKALDRATEADAYTRKIAELAADLSQNAGDVSHPLLAQRPQLKKIAGAGAHVQPRPVRRVQRRHPAGSPDETQQLNAAATPFDLEISGKRGLNFFKFQRIPATASYTQFEDKPSFEEVDKIASRYIDLFVSGQVDQVVVVYQKFLNAARQVPVTEMLLPLSSVNVETKKSDAAAAGGGKQDYEFMPTPGRDPRRTRARGVQGAAVQVLPRRGRERADRPPRRDEGRDRERRRPDQGHQPRSTTGPGRRTSRRKSAN